MLVNTAVVSFAFLVLALYDWRKGALGLFVIVVLQDVFRKLTPAAPPYYILWTGAMFGLLFLLAYAKGAIRGPRPLYLDDARLRKAWAIFVLLVLLQAGHALQRWGSPIVPALGVIFYLGPIAALLVGIAYARSLQRIDRFLVVYVLIMVPAVLTVYLSPNYADQWPVLRDVGSFTGTQLIISNEHGPLASNPGVFRVGELAAWHAATAAAFLSVLAIRRPSMLLRILAGVAIVAMIGAIILTGRRKMLMTLTIFFAFQAVLLLLLRKGLTGVTVLLLILAVAGSFAFTVLGPDDADRKESVYVERGLTVFAAADERAELSFNLMQSAWYQSGLFGVGVGATGQGTRYADSSSSTASGLKGAAEAGMGMIVVELGASGALIVLWFVASLGVRLWKGLQILALVNQRLLVYAVSFAAMLIANMATFGAATQLYSDHAVLIIMGLVAGMLFALLNVGIQEYRAQRQQTALRSSVPDGLAPSPAMRRSGIG